LFKNNRAYTSISQYLAQKARSTNVALYFIVIMEDCEYDLRGLGFAWDNVVHRQPCETRRDEQKLRAEVRIMISLFLIAI
jgi:hypothetical protein